MKKNLSPGVVVLIIAVVVIIVGLVWFRKASPTAKQKDIDAAIQNTVVKPGANMPIPNAPAAPAQTAPADNQ